MPEDEPPLWSLLRKRIVVCFVAAIACIVVGLYFTPWFRVWVSDKRFVIIGPSATSDSYGAPSLHVAGAYSDVAWIVTVFATYIAARLVAALLPVLFGHPIYPRLGWLTPLRARVHVLAVLAAAIACWFFEPKLWTDTEWFIEAPQHDTLLNGDSIVIIGLLFAELGLYLLVMDPMLAATQGWSIEPVSKQPRKQRRERPMIDSPLPQAVNVDGDPFRGPPIGGLEAKLVNPARPQGPTPTAEDPNAPKPKLLH